MATTDSTITAKAMKEPGRIIPPMRLDDLEQMCTESRALAAYSVATILDLIRTYGDLCCDVVGAMEHAGFDDVEEARAKAAALLDDIGNQLRQLEAHNAAS